MTDVTASAALQRTSLSLPDLTISGDGTGTYSFTERGIGRINRTVRYTYAPANKDTEGQVLTQFVPDIASREFEVIVQATSAALLVTALEALDACLFQARYVTTVTVGGVARSWSTLPTIYQEVEDAVLHAHWSQFFEVVSFTTPIQPSPVTL